MTDCPTPWKIGYQSRRAALTFAKGQRTPLKSGQVHPYLCDCGAWHLTSMARRTYKRLRKRAA